MLESILQSKLLIVRRMGKTRGRGLAVEQNDGDVDDKSQEYTAHEDHQKRKKGQYEDCNPC